MKKPMLLSNEEYDLKTLDYTNMRESKKRDGVRAEVTNKGILNRSLKILRNSKVQEYFREIYEQLPDGIIVEAEVYSDTNPCRIVAGICNSLDKDLPADLKLYFFGMYDSELSFDERHKKLLEFKFLSSNKSVIVEQHPVKSYEDAIAYYDACIDDGYEGAVLMDGTKKYKEGRVTIKQHIGYKIKPSRTDDLLIIGVTERMLNTNESQTNELGHSYKRNTVDAKQSTGIAATFICKMDSGEEPKVTITGEESFRREIWENKEKYIGQYCEVLSMDYGVKDKPRHPRLIKIKHSIEK